MSAPVHPAELVGWSLDGALFCTECAPAPDTIGRGGDHPAAVLLADLDGAERADECDTCGCNLTECCWRCGADTGPTTFTCDACGQWSLWSEGHIGDDDLWGDTLALDVTVVTGLSGVGGTALTTVADALLSDPAWGWSDDTVGELTADRVRRALTSALDDLESTNGWSLLSLCSHGGEWSAVVAVDVPWWLDDVTADDVLSDALAALAGPLVWRWSL